VAWTAADVTTYENAIRDLVNGDRIVRVTTSSGRSVEYGQADLPQLRALLAEARAEVAAAAATTRFVLTRTEKGL